MPLPLISVCIPAYNCEQFISLAIESVLTQSYTNFELIIIDDNSTDNTYFIAKHTKDTRIKLIKNRKNIGLIKNWNKCIKEAKGKYFKLLPGDDYLLPGCLKKQIEILESPLYHSVVLVCCSRKIIKPDSSTFLIRSASSLEGVTPAKTLIKKSLRKGTNIIGEPGAVTLRMDTLHKTGLFNENIWVIDLDFWIRVLQHGDAYIQTEPLCTYRISNNSVSVSLKNQQAKDFIKLIYKTEQSGIILLSFFHRLQAIAMAYINNFSRMILYASIFSSNQNN